MTLDELAARLITMRQQPVSLDETALYPALVAEFEQRMAACDDLDTLRRIVLLDSDFNLPTVPRQQAFEHLLAAGERSRSILKAYLLHLAVFGYIDDNGFNDAETDAKMNALEAELADSDKTGG